MGWDTLMDVEITATATDTRGRSIFASILVAVIIDAFTATYLGDY
jgi:hypothetical protein